MGDRHHHHHHHHRRCHLCHHLRHDRGHHLCTYRCSVRMWTLLVFVFVLSSRLTSADDYDDGSDFNYYDDDDSDDEFQYGDVYTFDEDEAPIQKKGKAAPLRFQSNKVDPNLLAQSIDEGFLLQNDHKEYSQEKGHPGAGVHNGHEDMDKTHTNLVHDTRNNGRYGDVADDVVPTYRQQGQTKLAVHKTQYKSGYDADIHQPAAESEGQPRFNDYNSDLDLFPMKPRKVPYGRGGLSRESAGIPQFGPYQKVKPPFLKAVPVKEDDFRDDSEVQHEYFKSEDDEDGYHFTSSKRIAHL